MHVRSNRHVRARLEVLFGALAFAASVPAGKLLLRGASPLALSGGLYLAAGLLCALLIGIDAMGGLGERNRLAGREWLWMGGAVLLGGMLGPLALFYGLRLTDGYVAGLLLNLEAVFTVGLGVLVSGERVGPRGFAAIALVIAGAALLAGAVRADQGATHPLGALLVVAACACWGLDNNFTQRISVRDARQIVAIKGVAGGVAILAIATALGQLGTWSAARFASVALLGSVSYGLSIVLFVRGLRELGVVHTATLFALAPGFASLLSWLILRETVRGGAVAALALMSGGALLLASDVHEHEHTHEPLEHAHVHEHDEHHQHEHTPEELAQVPHAHRHRHGRLTHSHPHTHDIHHRHKH